MDPGIDHLVIGAADLDQGRLYVEDLLGTPMSPGGKHPQMGTHNCLLSLGPSTYLEVIAVDPASPAPTRPRWFGLDHPQTAARLEKGPGLLTWVVHGVTAANLEPSVRDRLGPAATMRRGSLEWRITLPVDGLPPAGGVLPAHIEWAAADHPALGLPDAGCRLKNLRLNHFQAEMIIGLYAELGVAGLRGGLVPGAENTDGPAVTAEIQTPQGVRRITSPPQ